MNEKTRKIAGLTGSALMAASMGATAAVAVAEPVADAQPQGIVSIVADAVHEHVTLDQVQGTFAFTQDELSTPEEIAAALGSAPQYLCDAAGRVVEPNERVGAISVTGDVAFAYTATTEELIDRATETFRMGCSCAGNPADGRASVNAEVTGISLARLLGDAVVAEGANTVVFTSADGYEVALPLDYVKNRYCPIVFDVAGAPIAETVGGTNQLWLGSTSARYFARDIVSIEVQTRGQADVPARPGSPEAGDAYANLPNVGVYFGGEVR